MKKILMLLCIPTLLASSGCAMWHGHDHADDPNHRSQLTPDDYSGGGNHWEHEGDFGHEDDW